MVVDDLRFPNEFEIFDVTIRVIRPNAPKHDRSKDSEGLLDDHTFDYIIENNGTKEDLIKLTNIIIQDIERKL